jgi:hypothetical protein
MNYWQAAVRDTGTRPLPAPGSLVLLLAALGLLALRTRRSR